MSVTGIGIEKAAKVFYRANRDLLTSSSDFATAKTTTEQAAWQLGYTAAEQASVTSAWHAVGVGVPTTLSNGVSMGNISGTMNNQTHYKLSVPACQQTWVMCVRPV